MSLCDCTGHVSFYITCLFHICVSVTCSFVLLWLFSVLSPYAFSICDTSDPQYEPYQYGGIAKQVKASSTLLTFVSCCNFYTMCQRCLFFSCSGLPQKCPLFLSLSQESLETQLSKPDILTADLSKIEVRIFWEYFILFFCCFENECHLLAAMFDGAKNT